MFTRPDDLSDAAVIDALSTGWGLRVRRIEYVPLGFGSYHWRVDADGEQRFVTADDLAAKRRVRAESLREPLRRLSAALSTARLLRDAGLVFVVAPTLTNTGDVIYAVDDRFAVALYPDVDGAAHAWGPYPSRADRLVVLDLIAAIHETSEPVRRAALVDDFAIPSRDELMAALDDLAGGWESGPFGEPARVLLARHATSVQRVLEHYDRLVAEASGRPERMVLTHGEPHRGNTITTDDGLVLIDWDTALIAPPERDLWALADEDPQILDDYTARTGVAPNGEAVELYRLWWDLTEISIYIGLFRQPHRETADTSLAWDGVNRYLDPDRWRAVL